MANPWFRMYSEFATDPKVQMLSEADQRRLTMLLCFRCNSDKPLTDDEVAFQLRISSEDWISTKAKFVTKGFTDSDNNILNWDKRQFVTGGQGGEPTSKSSNYVYIVADKSQFVAKADYYVVKIGISKNPWARVKELQTGNDKPIEIVASFRADIVSDSEIHAILGMYRTSGEWFSIPSILVNEVIEHSKDKTANYITFRSLVVEKLRSNTTVATITTTDTDTDTDAEIKTYVSNDVANCPHEEILKLYSQHLPMLTQVKVWSDARMKLLKARWREDKKRQSLDWWERMFKYIAQSDFLTGKATDWQADIEWILNAKNFIKILEGKYENKS